MAERPGKDEQKEAVLRLRQGQLEAGQGQFLVSARWWALFSEYVQLGAPEGAASSVLREEAPPPPQIDNEDLLAEGPRNVELGILRAGLSEGQDYEMLPQAAWEYLHGIYAGGPVLRRVVISRGNELVVERYPLIATVETLDEQGKRVPGAAAVQMISRDATVEEVLARLHPSGPARLYAHMDKCLVLADGEDMDATTLRGWKFAGVEEEGDVQIGDLQFKDGLTLLVEPRSFGEWKFQERVRRANGRAHWKDPTVDPLVVGDRVDFDADENGQAGGQWLSAVVVAVGGGSRDGEVQLCCPSLVGSDDALSSRLARMTLQEMNQVEEGPATPWVQVNAGKLQRWHTHELAFDDEKRQPFGLPRDLRAGDKCEVRCDGAWSVATVQRVDWEEMMADVKTGQGAVVTVAIEGDDLDEPGSRIGAVPAPGTGRAGGGVGDGDRYSLPPPPEVEELNGICGLSNLGNTCFMNSALQALSNTPSWRDFFVSRQYEADINVDNPLGHKGRLATEFGNLMQQIWSNRHSSVSPTAMKRAISDANPMFAGYQQHDSHELLSFLLDAIHEDLNRVKHKPITEPPDHDGTRPDAEIAALSWDIHLKRNQSVVVDHFHGQLRSQAQCLECNRISIKFDEVMYLPVPLPQPTTKPQQVTVVRDVCGPGRTAVQTVVEVPLSGVIGDMRDKLAEMTGIDSARLYICEVYQSRMYKVLADTAALRSIQARDIIFAYELDEGTVHPLQVLNRKPARYTYGGPEKFAYPLLVGLPTGCTNRDVRKKMQQIGNMMLKEGQAERFLRMQEAAELAMEPAIAKAKELLAEGAAKLESDDPTGAIACFTEGVDTLAKHVSSVPPGFDTDLGGDTELPVVLQVEHACRTGRAAGNISRAEAENDKQALLNEAVADCELVLQYAPQNVRALYLRGRAGALRADGLVQYDAILRELRYAKGLFWKAGELDRGDQAIEHERVQMNLRLQEREDEVSRTSKGVASALRLYNRRSTDVDVHWIKTPATETEVMVTKYMGTVTSGQPDPYRASTQVGARFVVYEKGNTQNLITEISITLKPCIVFLHDDEEEQARLTCENMLKTKGGMDSRDLEAAKVSRVPPSSDCYTLVLADPARNDKGQPLPDDDEPFPVDRYFSGTSKAVCFDWTAGGLDARDASKDQEDSSATVNRVDSVDGALPLSQCLDEFVKLETLSPEDLWYCPRCKDLKRCTKKFSLWSTPNILVIQLKRFSTTNVRSYSNYGTMATTEKITTPVDFPDVLDLSPYIQDGQHGDGDAAGETHLYDLYAVINQSGGLAGGHYYTYARTLSKVRTAEWYQYNDSYVSKMSADAVRTPNAYVLFYQRRAWNGGHQGPPIVPTPADGGGGGAV